ncbi:unnamed protein product [Brassica rapa subsp. trilocularis]
MSSPGQYAKAVAIVIIAIALAVLACFYQSILKRLGKKTTSNGNVATTSQV